MLDEHIQREAYGLLAANLRFGALTAESKVLLISSASPAEGKTSTTLGIARALARMGVRVVAIEADLRRPTFAKHAALGDGRGIAGVLSDRIQVTEGLVEVDADTLEASSGDRSEGGTFQVLPAGDLPGNPQRALGGLRMAAILKVTRALADVVLVDTAPIGTVNDAVPLLAHVDGVVLVARLNRTTTDSARRALRVLRNVDVPVVGVVVTDAGTSEQYDYYAASPDAGSPLTPTGGNGTGRGGARS